MRLSSGALLAATALLLAGCGSQEKATPVACLNGAQTYIAALGAAPAEVRLDGEVPISNCLVENQKAGELATAGMGMVEAATTLNAEARAHPGGSAALELGYLLGAAQRAAEQTNGIHAELVRRLTVAARFSPENRPLAASFQRAYREGFDAGHARG